MVGISYPCETDINFSSKLTRVDPYRLTFKRKQRRELAIEIQPNYQGAKEITIDCHTRY